MYGVKLPEMTGKNGKVANVLKTYITLSSRDGQRGATMDYATSKSRHRNVYNQIAAKPPPPPLQGLPSNTNYNTYIIKTNSNQ